MTSLANTLGGGADNSATTSGRTEITWASADATLAGVGELKEWVDQMPEMKAPLAEWLDLVKQDAWRVAPAWRNWVNASKVVTKEQTYALETAGFSQSLAEENMWDMLMTSINTLLELDEADYELVLYICEYNRSLRRFRQTVETELAAAAERDYAPHVVESVKGMIEIARDDVLRARQKIILCEGKDCTAIPTSIFYHMDEGKVFLCEPCWNFACHHQTYREDAPTPENIHRQLTALDEERKEMRKMGRKDTVEYALLDSVAQSLVDKLNAQ